MYIQLLTSSQFLLWALKYVFLWHFVHFAKFVACVLSLRLYRVLCDNGRVTLVFFMLIDTSTLSYRIGCCFLKFSVLLTHHESFRIHYSLVDTRM